MNAPNIEFCYYKVTSNGHSTDKQFSRRKYLQMSLNRHRDFKTQYYIGYN